MKLFLVFSAFAVLALCQEEIPEEDHVLVLNTKNFEEAVKNHEYLLVEFYAPWCGHCKALAPEYKKAAEQLHEAGSKIRLAKVDATVETSLAEKHDVHGYPTLKFSKGGQFSDYKGGRRAADIVDWLIKRSGPILTELQNSEDAKKFIDSGEVTVIGFVKSEAAKAILETVADQVEGVAFAITDDQPLFNEFGVTSDNAIVLFKKFDEGKVVMEGYTPETKASDVVQFIHQNELPLVVEFSADIAPKVFGGDIKKHVLLFVSGKADDVEEKKGALRQVAQTYRGQVLCLHIDTDVEENTRVMDFFGIKPEELPELRAVIVGSELRKFKPEKDDFSAAYLTEFVGSFLNGNLKPHLLSQTQPEDWDKDPVKILVSSSFAKIARDPTKIVFVEFYAPWCGHCKALAPIWEKLGEEYKDSPDVIIAKMDATANELEDIKIQSFPTLKLFPRVDDSNSAATPIDYAGDRTLEAMKKFVDSNGKEGGKPPQEDEEPEEDEEEEEQAEKKAREEL